MNQRLRTAWVHLQVVTVLVHFDLTLEEIRHLHVVAVVGHDLDFLAAKSVLESFLED